MHTQSIAKSIWKSGKINDCLSRMTSPEKTIDRILKEDITSGWLKQKSIKNQKKYYFEKVFNQPHHIKLQGTSVLSPNIIVNWSLNRVVAYSLVPKDSYVQ